MNHENEGPKSRTNQLDIEIQRYQDYSSGSSSQGNGFGDAVGLAFPLRRALYFPTRRLAPKLALGTAICL